MVPLVMAHVRLEAACQEEPFPWAVMPVVLMDWQQHETGHMPASEHKQERGKFPFLLPAKSHLLPMLNEILKQVAGDR